MTCPRPDEACTNDACCGACLTCAHCLPDQQSPVSPCSGVRDGRDGAGWHWETPGTAERRTGPMCVPVHMTEETR